MRQEDAPLRVLVAWFRFGLNGSIARVLRFAEEAGRMGHSVEFASLTGETRREWPEGPAILGAEGLTAGRWDAVLVPGAGEGPLQRLADLRDPRFGRRIQLVLNDAARLDRFAEVNAHFAPDTIVFNNSAWTPYDMRRLQARAYHVLPGAVDTARFAPRAAGAARRGDGRFVVGAYARKGLDAVLDAMDRLGPGATLHVFGEIPGETAARADALAARGRLVPAGELFGDALARWYGGLDAFVSVETSAGWSNPVAEAMASGLPCVAGRGGTVDFVEPGRNALRVDEATGTAIAAALEALRADPARAAVLGRAAAATMRRFPWSEWSRELLRLVAAPAPRPYYRDVERGLFGKWDPEERLRGLEPVLAEARDASVLDLGAAEGVVSGALARAGARVLHAFERDPERVAAAAALLGGMDGPDETRAETADLADWAAFARSFADSLRPRYDIVLFLGLYHHLPADARDASLRGALARAERWFAVRTPPSLAAAARRVIEDGAGWSLHSAAKGDEDTGWLGIYRRETAGRDASRTPRVPVAHPERAETAPPVAAHEVLP